jgi:archaeosortase A (PGF-CTERM-specific)
MGKDINTSESQGVAFLFLLVPTIMLIIGYFIYPYDPDPDRLASKLLQIPIFLSLILLGIGFLIKKGRIGNKIKILGWMVFAFFWSTQPASLYISEGGDAVNAAICIIGVYILSYLAYHEWLSLKRNENIGCLNWIAGASCIAGLVYYVIERTVLQDWMIEVTANQSAWVLNLITGDGVAVGDFIFFNGQYVVTIIFACTAIQAMAIFIGMIGVIPKIDVKRRIFGLIITLIPIYILNHFRNAMVVFLVGNNITDFNMAHNYLSKTGSLLTLVVLLFIISKIIPEILDEIISLTDLYKRNGPLEKFTKKFIGRKKQNEPS